MRQVVVLGPYFSAKHHSEACLETLLRDAIEPGSQALKSLERNFLASIEGRFWNRGFYKVLLVEEFSWG